MDMPPPRNVETRTAPQTMSRRVSDNLGVPSSSKTGMSPQSYGAMTGISFTNGGGFSFEGRNNSLDNRMSIGRGATPKSYKRNTSGLSGMASPSMLSTSITMGEPGSFSASSHMFGLGTSNPMLSSSRRSYAAAVSGSQNLPNLSSSFASMSFQPMSLGVSYSKNQVLELMREHEPAAERYICCAKAWIGLVAFTEHMDKCHPDGLPEHEIPVPLTGTEREAEDAALDLELAEIEADTIPEITRTIIQYPLPPSNSDKANTPVEELPDPTDFNLADFIHSPIKSPYMAERPAPQTSSSSSTPPDGSLATPTTSTQHSPVQGGPLLKNGVQRNFLTAPNQYLPSVQQQTRFDRAFNDVVIGNAVDNKPSKLPTHIAPGLLGGSTAKNLGIPTVPPTGPGGQPTVQQEGEASKEPVLPEPSLFATTKPWRCPNPGCNKAYKQSNGLKYHQSKGQCDFAIHEAVDLGLSVEEAEERNRPFVCAVGAGCQKRYRQMNGLKYHYLNSGEHGQYGLRMLQNGTHPQPPPSATAPPKRHPTAPSGIQGSRPSAAPYHVPSQNGGMRHGAPTTVNPANTQSRIGMNGNPPRMGVFPNARPNPAAPAAQARPRIQPPVTQGRDAVLYSNVGTGSNDPLDIMSRMD